MTQEQESEGKSIADLVKKIQELATSLEFSKGREENLEGQVDHYKALSTLDEQTGIPNYRGICDFLKRTMKAANRDAYKQRESDESDSRAALTIALLDLNDFGQYNKGGDHIEGDKILRHFAEFVSGNLLRPLDFVGRFGGDEFFVGFPYTPIEGAHINLDRLGKLMKGPNAPKVSYTGGVVQYDPDKHETPEELLADASGTCMKGNKLEPGKVYSVINGRIQAYSSNGTDQ